MPESRNIKWSLLRIGLTREGSIVFTNVPLFVWQVCLNFGIHFVIGTAKDGILQSII